MKPWTEPKSSEVVDEVEVTTTEADAVRSKECGIKGMLRRFITYYLLFINTLIV